jgi:hypothetical protein
MKGQWIKQGLLYALPQKGLHPKLVSHTANPTPFHLYDDTYRIFFSSRDSQNRSSIGAVDIDILTKRVVKEHDTPFIEHGPLGSFYQDGISLGNYYEASGRLYLTFMGWQNPPDGHWRGDIGRLVVKPDLSLEIASSEPLIASDQIDPLSLSYPWVIRTRDERYDMWYGSTLKWDAGNGEMLHVLKHAQSTDGEIFTKTTCEVPSSIGIAQAFSRPTVLNSVNSGWHMWFSYRAGNGVPYRIGHATSEDGMRWALSLTSGNLDVSPTGWDSHMVEYPYVFRHKDEVIMLYNGDGYGKTGFGMATLTPSHSSLEITHN